MFREEIKTFFEAIEKKTRSKISLEEGRDVLEVCLAIKKSLNSGNVEYL
jgi:predicted dehydrogenase